VRGREEEGREIRGEDRDKERTGRERDGVIEMEKDKEGGR